MTDMPVVVIPAFSVSAPSPWNRVSWAEMLPMIVARLNAQGFTVKLEETKNA
jgi:hypothetical protein